MRKSKILFIYVYSLLSMCFLAGCWDQVELEERGFVIGSAIDLKEQDRNGNYQLTFTNQIVIPSGLGMESGSSGGETESYTNVSASGESIFDINRNMAKLTSRTPYYQHTKLVVVSEDVVQEPYLFKDVMDYFIREQEMRRGIRILIAKGEAKKILNVEPVNEKIPTLYIDSLLSNTYNNAEMIEATKLDDMQANFLYDLSYVVPLVTADDNKVRYDGVALFKAHNNQMAGALKGEALMGLNLITGNVKGGSIKIEMNGKKTAIEILEVKKKVKIDINNKDNIMFTVDIKLNTAVAESFGQMQFSKKDNLEKLKKTVEEKTEEITNNTVEALQHDYGVDVLRFSNLLYQRHYDFWQTIRDDWDDGEKYFSKSKVKINVEAVLEGTGVKDQTKKGEV
ncbi:Ger(x)C family spore germination protein [Virgibacillus sp. SK37]|uniref:Ger(x)C family spore germination protein n=1 Tax=Virgibacillus sp. SK37 TaxID=403957 RepID=UPI0004D1973B|nr:Ger(x)C family spore germination protein [Virgibacillus sp. SK37]AIF45173.1 hypothetical protein X953_03405 [Virgibacillus sp. SK37]